MRAKKVKTPVSVREKYGLAAMNVGDCVKVQEEEFKKAVSVTGSLSKNRTKVFTTNRSDLTIRRVG